MLFLWFMQTPFGYTRKDVLLIGVGVIGAGFALKYGLEVSHMELALPRDLPWDL